MRFARAATPQRAAFEVRNRLRQRASDFPGRAILPIIDDPRRLSQGEIPRRDPRRTAQAEGNLQRRLARQVAAQARAQPFQRARR